VDFFKAGINMIIQGIENNSIIAMMCSEKDPLACHRFHSISKELKLAGIGVKHILEDGEVKSQEDLELGGNLKSTKTNLF
jgi:hypothetical protein